MHVKFVDLGRQHRRFRKEILAAFDDVSSRGEYILGPEVGTFEERFAAFCGTKWAVSVANGSDALHMSLECLGVGQGHEVVIPALSFVATAWTVARSGAKPVFCDVRDDMNMDPAGLEEAATRHTRAVMPVHLTGRVADMEAILDVARRRGLHVVEDAAQAVGAVRNGRKAGAFGVCAGFSLHPLKNLHVHGDGGVVTGNDEAIRERLLKLRNHGLMNRVECEFWGINSRLDTVQAAIALIKLAHLDEINERFRAIAARYTAELSPYVTTPAEAAFEQPVYHRYMIQVEGRDALKAFLAEQGVESTANYTVPLHLQPAARSLGYAKGDFPVAERLAGTMLSLPIYAELRDDEVNYVIEKVVQYCKRNGCRCTAR